MWSRETLGREEEEGDVDATDGTKEERGGISRAVVVTTPTLSKDVTIVDGGATTELTEETSVVTIVVGKPETYWIGREGGVERVEVATVPEQPVRSRVDLANRQQEGTLNQTLGGGMSFLNNFSLTMSRVPRIDTISISLTMIEVS